MSSSTRTGMDSGSRANGKPTTRAKKPRSQRKAHSGADFEAMPWEQWAKHLTSRKAPRDLEQLLGPQSVSPLLWATGTLTFGPGNQQSEPLSLVDRLRRQTRRKNPPEKQLAEQLEQWLSDTSSSQVDVPYALESLAWCHALPRLAECLPAAPWWQLHDHLLATARESAGIDLDASPLTHQLLSGELPLTMAYLFPEFANCQDLLSEAGKSLSHGADHLLDGNGMISAEHIALVRPLLGCWTRAGYLGRAGKIEALDETAQNQVEWLLRQALRLTRFDGSQTLCDREGRDRSSAYLFEAALKLTGDADDKAAAALALSRGKSSTASTTQTKKKLPESASHSEWAETAVLRSSWLRGAERLTVTYADRSLQAELSCGGQTFFSGSWNPRVTVDGRELLPRDDWEEVCWHSDADVDYLELEITLDRGWKIQRQFLLAREDRFLLVGDAILGNESGKIQYHSLLPLADDVQFAPAKDSHEGVLKGSRSNSLILPLALPEWRNEPTPGSFETEAGGLALSLSVEGQRLYAPLFFDLNPRHRNSRLTWRRLTVAEQLQIQPNDTAVGYRLQVSNQQWLIYRSLGPRGNRTLLGQNFSSEFFAGRFGNDGETKELLEIE